MSLTKHFKAGFFWARTSFYLEQQIAGEESDRVAEWQIALQDRLQKELLAAGCRGADCKRFEQIRAAHSGGSLRVKPQRLSLANSS